MPSAFDILNDYFYTQRQQRRQDQLLADERSFILGREREAREFQSQRYAELDKVNTDYANQIAGEIEDLTSQFETEYRKFEAEAARSAMKVAVEKMPEKLREKFTKAGAIGSNESVVPDTFLDLMGSLKGSDADAAELAYDQAMSSVLEAKEYEFRTRVRTIERAITSKQTLYRQVVGDIRNKSGLESLGSIDSQSSPTQGLLPENDIEDVISAAGDRVGSIGNDPQGDRPANPPIMGLGYEGSPAQALVRNFSRGLDGLDGLIGKVSGYFKDQLAPLNDPVREFATSSPGTNQSLLRGAVPPLPGNPPISRNELASPQPAPARFQQQPSQPARGASALDSSEQVSRAMMIDLFGTDKPEILEQIRRFATTQMGHSDKDGEVLLQRTMQGDQAAENRLRQIGSAYWNQGLGLMR